MGTSLTRPSPHNVAERANKEQKDNSFTSTIWGEREKNCRERETEARLGVRF